MTYPSTDTPRDAGDPSRIERTLRGLRRNVRASLATRGLALVLAIVAGLVLLCVGIDRLFRLSVPGRVVLLVLCVGVLAWSTWKLLIRPLFVRLPTPLLADLLERRFPNLGDRLRSALDFLRDPEVERLARTEEADAIQTGADVGQLLKRRVSVEAAAELEALEEGEAIDTARVVAALAGGLAALALVGVCALIWNDTFGLWAKRQFLLSTEEYPYRTHLELEGFTEYHIGVPRGDALEILARASGDIPRRVDVTIDYEAGTNRHAMPRIGDDPVFLYEVSSVNESFEVIVEGGDYRTPVHRVEVLERPWVEALVARVLPPEYTGLEPTETSGDVGEIAVPRGSKLVLRGRTNKPLASASLAAEGESIVLSLVDGDRSEFTGVFEPKTGGPATIELVDLEGVPPDRLMQFSTHLLADRQPIVQVEIRGLGPMITPEAVVPLSIEAKDDYRIDRVTIAWEVSGGVAPEPTPRPEKDTERPPPKGEAALPIEGLPANPVSAKTRWEIGPLEIRPERRLTLRVGAVDNDALDGAKTGYSPLVSFLVVTAERLGEEFMRREEEQRRILERIIEEEKGVRDTTYALIDGAWKKEGELVREDLEQLFALARKERGHGRQLLSIADAVEQILLEMENNRIGEADDLARLAESIIRPLRTLGETTLPDAATRFGAIRETRDPAVRIARGIELARLLESKIEQLDEVLQRMVRLEGFTEIVRRLRAIIRTQKESSEMAREIYQDAVEGFFDD